MHAVATADRHNRVAHRASCVNRVLDGRTTEPPRTDVSRETSAYPRDVRGEDSTYASARRQPLDATVEITCMQYPSKGQTNTSNGHNDGRNPPTPSCLAVPGLTGQKR